MMTLAKLPRARPLSRLKSIPNICKSILLRAELQLLDPAHGHVPIQPFSRFLQQDINKDIGLHFVAIHKEYVCPAIAIMLWSIKSD